MMKKIRKNENSKFGFDWIEIDENGNENVIELSKKTTDNYLYLPENEFNRRLIGINFLENHIDENGEWIVVERSVKSDNKSVKSEKKGLEEYLEGDERELFVSLMKKAMENRDKIKNDPKKKLEEKIARLQAQLAEMAK